MHGIVPLIGLGTWGLWCNTCVSIVEQALKLGYRHIDTASKYGNEEEVGDGIRASGVNRNSLFITTKLWPGERSVKDSLTRLRLSHVDLLLLHWPNPRIPLSESLGFLTQAQEQGLTRYIGVSNFNIQQLEDAVKLAPIINNQVPYTPEMVTACNKHNVTMTAYSPISRGPGLKFLIDQGISVIPRTSNPKHLIENLHVL